MRVATPFPDHSLAALLLPFPFCLLPAHVVASIDCACPRPAEFVAHIQPPGESQLKFWDIDNWQALCEPCFQRIVGAAIPKVLEPIPRDAKLYTVK